MAFLKYQECPVLGGFVWGQMQTLPLTAVAFALALLTKFAVWMWEQQVCSWAVQSASYELREDSKSVWATVCHVHKNWTESAVGAGKLFWAAEVIAESFAKRKKRGELSLFRLANWKQKEDLIDVCRCQALRRETKLWRCWLRLNESRLAMGTVRLEIKRRLLNTRAAWNRSFWTSLSSEEQKEEPLSPWCLNTELVTPWNSAKGVVLV